MRFSKLPTGARGYILGVFGIAAVLMVVAWWQADATPASFGFVVLVLAATLAHCFPVSTPRRLPYQMSLPFLTAALLVLTPLQVVVLLAAIHVVDWLRHRHSWFGQAFNFSGYVIAATVARAVYGVILSGGAVPLDLGDPRSLAAGLALVVAFVLTNRLLMGTAIWLSNGTPPGEQQTNAPESVLVDAILLAMGLPIVHFWTIAPGAVVLTVAPLFLIHRALDQPDLPAQAGRDALTHLYSSESFADACERELARHVAFDRPLAVLMLDVDNLGKINEDYGHPTGDAIIQGTAQVIRRTLRPYDVAARVFGGNFAVLLPETEAEEAAAVARHLQGTVASRRFDIATSVDAISITVSIGLVRVDARAFTADSLVAAAQAALMNAKRAGSNQLYVQAASSFPAVTRPGDSAASGLAASAVDR